MIREAIEKRAQKARAMGIDPLAAADAPSQKQNRRENREFFRAAGRRA